MRRTALAAALALLAAAVHPANAAGTCSNDFVLQELREGKFGRIDRVADLPKEVLAEFQATIAKHDPPLLADPGEPYQATDVIGPDGPKVGRRLIFAGFSKELFYLYYERGGLAHTYHVFVYCHADSRKRLLSVVRAPEVRSPSEIGRDLRREQIQSPPRED